jgi:HPt (histidine-containing phosphotransfer) domain-containing protein
MTIIALTAHAMEGDREKSIEAGMDDHLSKPFTIDQLKATLAAHLPDDRVAPAAVTGDSAQGNGSGTAARVAAETADGAPAKGCATDGEPAIDRAAIDRIRQIDPDGRDGLARTVITCYLTDSPKTIESLKVAVNAGDGNAIRTIAHGLKSSSANVGAMGLAGYCKEMEITGRANALDRSPDLLLSIENEFARARTALEAEI